MRLPVDELVKNYKDSILQYEVDNAPESSSEDGI